MIRIVSQHRQHSYWACVVARNAESHLRTTLDSLLNQDLGPEQVIIVNDGSTDETGEILANYADRHPDSIQVMNLPDRGYDIRRVPRNINLAWNKAQNKRLRTKYFMISGDDCRYPKDYAQSTISRMNNDPHIAVASGFPRSGRAVSTEHSPSGSGRMIRCSFWKAIGEEYPVKAGWETWLLYKALEKRLEVKLFDDLIYEHLRPRGTVHQFGYWGAAMHALGYHPLYALGRIAKNFVTRKTTLKGLVNMLEGYLLAFLGSSDPFISRFEQPLRIFVRTQQRHRIARIGSLLTAIRTSGKGK
jgi:biofilm PGA synthesis N-glycosyltransferase PgaC